MTHWRSARGLAVGSALLACCGCIQALEVAFPDEGSRRFAAGNWVIYRHVIAWTGDVYCSARITRSTPRIDINLDSKGAQFEVRGDGPAEIASLTERASSRPWVFETGGGRFTVEPTPDPMTPGRILLYLPVPEEIAALPTQEQFFRATRSEGVSVIAAMSNDSEVTLRDATGTPILSFSIDEGDVLQAQLKKCAPASYTVP